MRRDVVWMEALHECKYCGRHNVAASSRAGMCEACSRRYNKYYRLTHLPPAKLTERKVAELHEVMQEYQTLHDKGCKVPGSIRLQATHMV